MYVCMYGCPSVIHGTTKEKKKEKKNHFTKIGQFDWSDADQITNLVICYFISFSFLFFFLQQNNITIIFSWSGMKSRLTYFSIYARTSDNGYNYPELGWFSLVIPGVL